jgi:multisubunit Na+/H+ antiporter MnhG subunit
MSLPGAFFLAQSLDILRSARGVRDLLLAALYYMLAPGVIFGGLGAIALTLLASPAKKTRTLLVGTVTGFACPLAFFGALIVFSPKNEATLGWIVLGFIFSLTGALAGYMAGSAVMSQKLDGWKIKFLR